MAGLNILSEVRLDNIYKENAYRFEPHVYIASWKKSRKSIRAPRKIIHIHSYG